VTQGSEGEHPRGKTLGESPRRASMHVVDVAPGIEALKWSEGGWHWSARSSNRTRAGDRATGTRPAGEDSGRASRTAGARETSRRARSNVRTPPQATDQDDGPVPARGGGSVDGASSDRDEETPREPSRVHATREETVGADSQDGPQARGTRSGGSVFGKLGLESRTSCRTPAQRGGPEGVPGSNPGTFNPHRYPGGPGVFGF
jgi:hypothetical protein